MAKRILGILLKSAITVGLFVLLFRPQTFGLRPDLFGRVTPLSLWRELTEAHLPNVVFWLSLATIVKLSGMLAGVLRWRLLLRGQGLSMPFWYMVQSWFVGRFFGIFVPGTIGLDGYRLYDSSLYTREVIKCATVIAVEKLIGFISLTFLVFLTFPLGFRLLHINVAVLGVILAALAAFVAVSFLLLLNPRVIQVLAAVVPTPAAIRNKVDKLGAAITAYSGKRALLLAAVACGLWVHLATCFMFFGTMMSLRAANTSLLDILFASPIMIYGTVLGPSVGGEGIREIVFATLLGATSGVATAVLFGHLGWWVGDVIPFLIGAPILILRSRPGKKQLEAEVAAVRKEVAGADRVVHLPAEAVAGYRNKLINCVLAGIGGGLIAGALVGLGEAYWIKTSLEGLTELTAFWWGPLVYGLVFAGVGLGVAGGLAFLYLLFDRFAPSIITFGLSLGGALAAGGIIAVWRYTRDVLQGHPPSVGQVLLFIAGSMAVGLVAAVVGSAIAWVFPRKRVWAVGVGAPAFVVLVAAGAGYGALNAKPAPVDFRPAAKAAGPNIILVVADALRADYLKMYAKDAEAQTPNLEAFARDTVFFSDCFAQASWTKPSFATLFSARYPACHTATSKVSMLPDEVVTFPEVLEQGGYFTKGFANNPNIAAAFNFNQGFADYVDLKPRLYFEAGESASKLALYGVLRQVYNKVMSKISSRMVVTDFYQPAEVVTQSTLEWLDGSQRPKDAPFFLFLHYMDTHDPFMDYRHPGAGYARVRLDNPDPGKYLEPMRGAYISDIEHLDKHFGALIDGLRQRGLYDNAVILFVADHGEEFFDHGGWWHGQTLFDELIHVPLLLKLPRNEKAGTVNSSFARHIDVGPTLLHFAGLKPDPGMAGKSLIDDKGDFTNQDIKFTYAENDFENNVLQAVRTRDAKAIHANEDNPRNRAPREFYDMQKDAKEKTNLAGKSDPREPELDRLVTQMTNAAKDCAPEAAAVSTLSDEQKRRLESLGYLGAQ